MLLLKIYQAVQMTDRSIDLNFIRLSTCTRPAGKRFHKEIIRTEKIFAEAALW